MAEEPMSPAEIERNIKRLDSAVAQKVSGELYVQEVAHLNSEIARLGARMVEGEQQTRERITEMDRKGQERADDVAKDAAAAVARTDKHVEELASDVDKRFKAQDEAVDKRFKDLADRGQTSWGRVTVVLTLVLALAGLLWGIYASSKGIK
ncbi:MAG: hypothetical protein HOV97_19455 [Nonomuraea sp.]|nr:hypothetical protein [Nonomuraea sp.]